jgi:hypothetical protein
MSEVFFENAKTGKRYTVIKFDPGAGKVTLKGEAGLEFSEHFDKAAFEQMGYVLRQS